MKTVGINGSNKDIGTWAAPEDKPVLVKVSKLSGRRWEPVTTSRRYFPRR